MDERLELNNHTELAEGRYDEQYQDGFNIKAILGGLFLGFIMLPGAIYLALVAGPEGSMQTAGQWVTVILFTEIARRCFTRLSRQEIIVLHMLAGGLVVAGGPFFALLWNQFLIQSAQVEQFGLLKELVKPESRWIAPPPGSEALAERTFLHNAWIPAIVVLVLSQLLIRLNQFTLGYTLFRITSDVERLPFPLAPIAAQGATALAESYEKEETWRWRVFSVGSALGMIFGLIYIVVPTVTGGIMNEPIQLLKIPWIELNTTFENILPASLVGISTNFSSIFIGFILPFPLVLGQFIGSISSNMIANPILYKMGVLQRWRPGMTSIPTSISNSLDLWLSFEIGTRIVIAILGIGLAAKVLLRKRDRGGNILAAPKGRGDFPIPIAVGIFTISTIGLVYLCHRLVPRFPWWIFALYGLIWTPLNSYISARMIGITGFGVNFPYLREASFILSTRYLNYSGVTIWFAPIPLHDHGGMTQLFKELELTKTKFTSIFKAQLLIFPLLLVCSVLFCSFLWKINQVPSAAYPYAARIWPFNAYWFCLWATGTQTGNSLILDVIKLKYILCGLGFGFGLYGICTALSLSSFFFYGVLTGTGTWPHYTIPRFVGALLGRYYFAKRFGKERWQMYTPVVTAGFVCGMGLAGMLSVGFTLISNSVIQLPY